MDRGAQLIEHLREMGEPASKLASQLWCCRSNRIENRATSAWGWPVLCKSVACLACGKWRQTTEAHHLELWAAKRAAGGLLAATIYLPVCGSLPLLAEEIDRFRRVLKRMRTTLGCRDGHWAVMEARGAIEAEPMGSSDLAVLPPLRAALVSELPRVGGDGWCGHAHVLFSVPGVGADEMAAELRGAWPGPIGRVHVAEVYEPMGIASYAAKGVSCWRAFAGEVVEAWPVCRQAEYLLWLSSHRNGLAPLRVRLDPVKAKVSKSSNIILGEGDFSSKIENLH